MPLAPGLECSHALLLKPAAGHRLICPRSTKSAEPHGLLAPTGRDMPGDFLSAFIRVHLRLKDWSKVSTNGQFQFDISGVTGLNYSVQASTNLVDWVPLGTNVSPFTFLDTNAAHFPQRFYRSGFVQ